MLNAGQKSPSFVLKDAFGNKHSLDQYLGKKVILYFYPKDNTPGCTTQACSFRNAYDEFRKKGVVILGVSLDDEASHKKFIEKHQLPFTLLADVDAVVSKQYGVYTQKQMYGRKYLGIERTTFLIDEGGIIMEIYPKASPSKNVNEILNVL